MSIQPFDGNSISFITTNNCTARCAHCVMCCNPGDKYMLTFEQMRDAVDQVRAVQQLKLVVFTGGEPTLLQDDLLKAIRYCRDLGCITRIVTNAYWATSIERAKEILTVLRQAGLDEVNFSMDDYHAPYVPIEYVRNAWKASKGMGFLSIVIANCHGEHDKIQPPFIKEFLGEDIQTRDPDHRHGFMNHREKSDPDGTLYIIAEGRVQKTGRAFDEVDEDSFFQVESQEHLNGCCLLVIEQPSISFKNDLWACCGINSGDNEILNLGSLDKEPYEKLIKKACNSIILNAIRYLGPYSLCKFVHDKDPSITFPDNFHSFCEICENLTTNKKAIDVLRKNAIELIPSIRQCEKHEERNRILNEKKTVKPHLQKLVEQLDYIGYGSFYNAMDPTRNAPEKWTAMRDKALPELQPYIDLLLLGRTVKLAALDSEIAEAIRGLFCLEIFVPEKDGDGDEAVRAGGVVLHPIFGVWMFYEMPNPGISAYFGQDSVALLSRQLPTLGKKCLDLCAGPGVQSLYAAKQGEKVTAVEINRMAAQLLKINALMNNLDKRITVCPGDLYRALDFGFLRDDRYDRITANPPLLPFPEDMPYAFIGHGGDDGFKVTWKIIDGLADHLNDDGFAQIIGVGLGDGEKALFLPKLQQKAEKYGLDVTVNIVSHIPMKRGDSYFEGMAETSHMYCEKPIDEIKDAMERCFDRQGAVEYLAFDLLIRRGGGQVCVQDLAKRPSLGLWYV